MANDKVFQKSVKCHVQGHIFKIHDADGLVIKKTHAKHESPIS